MSFIILSVITATLFIAAKQFLRQSSRTYGIFAFDRQTPKNVNQSTISDSLTCGCNINFTDFIILSNDSNNFNLLIKESLLIVRDKPF